MAGIITSLALGLAAGLAYFYVLHRSVALLTATNAPARILLGAMLRLAMAGAAFWLVITLGGVADLLTCLVGFLLGRVVMQRFGMPA